ncbi:U3 small nucleolar RNA-associated protein 15 homolog isoform X2 [Petromyzon marinus]|nr:U3 small nucleolar RNA-associated protein 15 homolog isoform X2 [Petromyzon marinus]
MGSFRPTRIQSIPQLGEKISNETLYWKAYRSPVQINEYGAVTHVHFSPTAPHHFAVSASTRVHVYAAHSAEPQRTFTRFRDVAFGATFRADGRLLVAGSEEGVVRVFEAHGRVPLRSFDGHKRAVRVSCFMSDGLRVLSGSDDCTARLWDVATGAQLSSFASHGDYVRSAHVCTLNPNLFITGSYDHMVRVFDVRQPDAVLTLDHGFPVESVLAFPSEGLYASAGGRLVKVWDAVRGGHLLACLRHHHKTVTALTLNGAGDRLLTASLDRHVKVLSTTTFKPVHSFDYPAAILSLGISPDDQTLVAGMTNGLLSVRNRKTEERQKPEPRRRRGATYRYYVRGKDYLPKKGDVKVSFQARTKQQTYDKLLRTFQHSRALDAVLEAQVASRHPQVTVSVMAELARRQALQSAIAGRDEQQLLVLLAFLLRNMLDPRFSSVLTTVADALIDIYGSTLHKSRAVAQRFEKLAELIEREVSFQQELLAAMGMMDALFAANTERKHAQGDALPAPAPAPAVPAVPATPAVATS